MATDSSNSCAAGEPAGIVAESKGVGALDGTLLVGVDMGGCPFGCPLATPEEPGPAPEGGGRVAFSESESPAMAAGGVRDEGIRSETPPKTLRVSMAVSNT